MTRNDSRIKNSIRNIISSIITISFITIMPFIIRTIMARIMGIECLGLNSFLMSIIQILKLSELGIGSVIAFFLYAPIAVNDRVKVNAYLNILHRFYNVVGVVILLAGIIILPFIKCFVKGAIPSNLNMYLCFILYLFGSAIEYFFYPEEMSLIDAFQHKDINNKICLIANSVTYLIQVIALVFFHNYYIYLVAIIVQGVLLGQLRKYYGHRYFDQYRPMGELSTDEKKEIKKKALSMLGHQIDEKLFNSIDTVFISNIIGLTAVAIYGNYFYIIVAVSFLFETIYISIVPSIGNALVLDSSADNCSRFYNIFWIGACLTGLASTCFICMCQNFMMLWMGTDKMLGMDMVVLFCIYFYLSQIRRTVVTFKNAAGMWWNDRYKPYISMAVDLLLDLVLIRYIGVKGAIISSIVCVGIIEIPCETRVLFRDYFNISTKQYIIKMLTYGVVNLGIITLVYLICRVWVPETGIVSLLIRMLICCGSVIIYAAVYWRSKEFRAWRGTLKGLRK